MLAGWVLQVGRMRPGKTERKGYSKKKGNDMMTRLKGSKGGVRSDENTKC